MDCSMPGLPAPHHYPKSAQVHVLCISDAIQPSHPLKPSSLSASIFPSIRYFSNESAVCIRWPKYWSFSFSISPSNEYSGLISLKIDWFDFLAVQRTLSSLLQHHSSKASIFWPFAFFTVQLLQPYVTIGKTIIALYYRGFFFFSMILRMLAIWFQAPLPFLKTAWTSKFMVHVLLKPGLKNFEQYFTSVWDECSCAIVWAFFGIAFLWDWNENWPFPVLWPLLSFPNLLAYWGQHFHSIIFQDLK